MADNPRQPLTAGDGVKAVPMYTVTPQFAVAGPVPNEPDANASSPVEIGVAVATPAVRTRIRKRRFGLLGCGLGLLSVFLVLFLCMARQPFLRLVEIDMRVDNRTMTSTLIEKYDMFNDNYYSMSWHSLKLQQYVCQDVRCDSDTAVNMGAAYVNDTIHQDALSTRRIQFEFDVSKQHTAVLGEYCKTRGYFDLLMIGHSKTKLLLSGQVDVDMGPQMYSVSCGDKASMF